MNSWEFARRTILSGQSACESRFVTPPALDNQGFVCFNKQFHSWPFLQTISIFCGKIFLFRNQEHANGVLSKTRLEILMIFYFFRLSFFSPKLDV